MYFYIKFINNNIIKIENLKIKKKFNLINYKFIKIIYFNIDNKIIKSWNKDS